MKNSKSLLPFLLMLAIYSCKKDEMLHTTAPSYSYVPTDTGSWILYDVDSTYYDNFYNPTIEHHFTFQVIERIHSLIFDNEGRPTQRLERVKRDNISSPWQNKVIWTSTLTSSRYEKVEDGIRFVKLGFPINVIVTWDGNAYNAHGYEEYSYGDIHVPKTISSLNFDSTITVNRGDSANVVYEKNGTEIFSNHVGMIYKNFVDIKFDTIPNHEGGVKYFYTINNYGSHNAPMPIEN